MAIVLASWLFSQLARDKTCPAHVLHCQRTRCTNHPSTDLATMKPDTHVETSIFAARSSLCIQGHPDTWRDDADSQGLPKKSAVPYRFTAHDHCSTKTLHRSDFLLLYATRVRCHSVGATSALAAFASTRTIFPERKMTVYAPSLTQKCKF